MIHEPSDIISDGDLTIGVGVNIRPFVSIICKHKITIGDDTQIGPGVRIVDFDHDMGENIANIRYVGNSEEVNIGPFCWIGANAVILKGVKLGYGCVVGAGTVVLKGDYLPGSIIVGNPGEVIKRRSI